VDKVFAKLSNVLSDRHGERKCNSRVEELGVIVKAQDKLMFLNAFRCAGLLSALGLRLRAGRRREEGRLSHSCRGLKPHL